MSVEEWIRDEKKGFLSNALLMGPSLVFGTAVRLRNYFYEKSLLSVQKSHLFVISIGNLVAGGTGKTPVTEYLVNRLIEDVSKVGQVAILSRGYRSLAEKREEPTLVSYGNGPIVSWEEAGDEAYLLAKKCRGALVISGPDRAKGANLATLHGAKVVILDDGMQHRKLFRNSEIVVIDSESPFGSGHFLPRGSLRDEPRRIREAELIVAIGDKIADPLRDLPNVAFATRTFKDILFTEGSLNSIAGKKVALFSGIGNPANFERLVKSLSANIVSAFRLGDHRPIDERKLREIAASAKKEGAEMLLCTEKDGLKLDRSLLKELALPLGQVRIEIAFHEGKDLIEKWLKKTKESIAL